MKMRSGLVVLLAGLAALAAGGAWPATGFAAGAAAAGQPDAVAVQPLALPDMSRAAESVREQIGEQHAALTLATGRRDATAAELGAAYGEMGKLLMAAEYHDAAEACFRNAQALAPLDARWPYYLGHVHKARMAYVESAASFERALELEPGDVPALVWLGEVNLELGRPALAETYLEQALAQQPDLVPALSGLGRASLATRDYARAVERLEQALAEDARAVSVHYPLAMAYRGLGDHEKAQAHLDRRGDVDLAMADPLLSELDGLLRSASAYETSGIQALEHEEWEMAAELFQKGIELRPDDPTLRHRRGTALALMGDVPGAVREFEEALRREPGFAQAHYSLGVILATNGRFAEATTRFADAVTYDDAYVEARLVLADLLRRSGREELALLHYAEVVEDDPRVSDARFGFAMALVQLGRYDEALERLDEGALIHPDRPEFVLAQGRLLASAPDDRVRDGRRALALMQGLAENEQIVEIDETMAMVLAELGDYEQAAALQREVLAEVKRQGWSGGVVDGMVENLELYEAGKPSRTPWTESAMP